MRGGRFGSRERGTGAADVRRDMGVSGRGDARDACESDKDATRTRDMMNKSGAAS